jgi:hypothetical protein
MAVCHPTQGHEVYKLCDTSKRREGKRHGVVVKRYPREQAGLSTEGEELLSRHLWQLSADAGALPPEAPRQAPVWGGPTTELVMMDNQGRMLS